jgi:hypothetical protein
MTLIFLISEHSSHPLVKKKKKKKKKKIEKYTTKAIVVSIVSPEMSNLWKCSSIIKSVIEAEIFKSLGAIIWQLVELHIQWYISGVTQKTMFTLPISNNGISGSLLCKSKKDTTRIVLTINLVVKSSRVVSYLSYMISSQFSVLNNVYRIADIKIVGQMYYFCITIPWHFLQSTGG